MNLYQNGAELDAKFQVVRDDHRFKVKATLKAEGIGEVVVIIDADDATTSAESLAFAARMAHRMNGESP